MRPACNITMETRMAKNPFEVTYGDRGKPEAEDICPRCYGTGKSAGDTCGRCKGTGKKR